MPISKTSQSEKEVTAPQSELETNENQYSNNIENNRVLVYGLAAANQSPRTTINAGPQNSICVTYSTILNTRGKYC